MPSGPVCWTVPEEFSSFLAEPAFNLRDTTFCIWRIGSASVWRSGPIAFPEGDDPDRSGSFDSLAKRIGLVRRGDRAAQRKVDHANVVFVIE
jgi:hypothetical protein